MKVNRIWGDGDRQYIRGGEGWLRKKYWNIVAKVRGMSRKRYGLKTLPVMGVEEFVSRGMENKGLSVLIGEWERSGRCRGLCPVVGLKKVELGYVLGNMIWMTFSEKQRRGARGNSFRRDAKRGV